MREESQTVSTRQCIASKIKTAERDGAVANLATMAGAAESCTSRMMKSEFNIKLKLSNQ
jgi:hypothetical protein